MGSGPGQNCTVQTGFIWNSAVIKDFDYVTYLLQCFNVPIDNAGIIIPSNMKT